LRVHETAKDGRKKRVTVHQDHEGYSGEDEQKVRRGRKPPPCG